MWGNGLERLKVKNGSRTFTPVLPERFDINALTWVCGRLAILMMAFSIGGCTLIGFAAHVIAGGSENKTVTVSAEYSGLDDHSVAVLVSADEYTFFEYPNSTAVACKHVSAALAAAIPGIRVIDPEQISEFQRENPYWNTLPYDQLLSRLRVDRLMHVDLIQYALHEPGNTYVWRGTVTANISIAAADTGNINQSVYNRTIEAQYPQRGPIGVVNSDHQTIQLGLLRIFTNKLVNLFQPHEEAVKQ